MPPDPATLRDLQRLGWDAHCQAALAAIEGDAWRPARVFADGRGVLTLSDGTSQWGARVSGRLRHKAQSTADLPVVGDWVVTRSDDEQPGAVVHVMLPRRTRIARKVAG